MNDAANVPAQRYEITVQVGSSGSAPVFSDVDYSDWYGDAVTFVAARGLITGYEGTTLFGVGDTLTRGQLATILWRNACPDEYASYDPKTAKNEIDIAGSADGMYYTAAANWAFANGVITGIVLDHFNPSAGLSLPAVFVGCSIPFALIGWLLVRRRG